MELAMDGNDIEQILEPSEAISHAFAVLHGKVRGIGMYGSRRFMDAMEKLHLSGALNEVDDEGKKNNDKELARWIYELLNTRCSHREQPTEFRMRTL